MLSRSNASSLKFAFSALFLGAFALSACSANDAGGNKAPKGSEGQGGPGNGAGAGSGTGPGEFDDEIPEEGTVDEDSACATVKRTGELVPLDMYVMLDKSGSMTEGGRWTSVTNALRSFVDSDDARGMGMGIGYYPIRWKKEPPPPPQNCVSSADCLPHWGDCMPFMNVCEGAMIPGGMSDSCVADDYKQPAVGIKLLPMVGDNIKSSLSATKPNGDSTPTLPALQGAHSYAKDWAAKNPGHVTVVVLATDGEPNNCGSENNNTTTIAQAASDAYKTNPSIPTFVIGVGDKVGELHSIAQAGGTNSAVYLSDSNAYQGLLDTLNEIRGSVACEYTIPAVEDGQEADYDRVNVNITAEGKETTIGRVAAASECHPDKGGWYYDNPKKPSKILLCHASCQVVKAGSQMEPVEVDVLLGCKSKIW